jgi:UDP-N-acetylmuramoylalanine-D-glutamate ligase
MTYPRSVSPLVDKNSGAVAVIGLGRFGSSLALELIRRGTEVLAIDHRPAVGRRSEEIPPGRPER